MEVKIRENRKAAQAQVMGRWQIRFIGPVKSDGDVAVSEAAFAHVDRANGISPDLVTDGLAAGQGLKVLKGQKSDWLPERDSTQPISVLQRYGGAVIHTRELLDSPTNAGKVRNFIVNVVASQDPASMGLGDLVQGEDAQSKDNTKGNVIPFPPPVPEEKQSAA